MTAVSLPDQIPPQGAPFVYQDDSGNWRMEVDWYLFLYAMWGALIGQSGGVAFLPAVNIPMIDLEALGADSAQTARQITNTALLQPDPPDAGPTLRDLQNALVLALDALLQDPSSAGSGGVSLSTVNVFTKNQSVAPVVLTDAASVTTDASLANDFVLTIGGNRALANPTNLTDGMQLLWTIIQDATGSRTLTYGSAFDFGASASSLSTAPGATDIIYGVYNTATGKIKCFIRRDAGSSTLGLQITAYPQGVVTSSVVGTTNLNNQAYLLPINLASPMWVQSLIVQCSAGGTVVLTWGLFDYSASASAPVMLVTGSGTAGAAGTITLPATGAPVYVPAGSYMLVFSAGPTGTASVVYRTTSVVGNALSKKSSTYTWTTTPNFTTGWSSDTTVINAVLQGRLSATDLW